MTDPILEATANNETSELSLKETGRWVIRTRDSIHLFDLDARTVTRIPGLSANPTVNDLTRPLRFIEACKVGHSGRWTMHPGPDDTGFDFFWARTSIIRSIRREQPVTNHDVETRTLEGAGAGGPIDRTPAYEAASDPRAVKMPRLSPMEQLWAQSGSFLDASTLSSRIGISANEATALAAREDLLVVPGVDGGALFPIWQFDDHGAIFAGIGEVLIALRTIDADPWSWARWLMAPSDETEITAIHRLRNGDQGSVVSDARRDAQQAEDNRRLL
jgi:hypothetical protein